MDTRIKENFVKAGVDVNEAMGRFLNREDLFITFMNKFKEDTNLQELKEALNKKDVEEAFIKAHTLKGVAGNLSMKGILKELVPMVEQLRTGSLGDCDERIVMVEQAYNDTMDAINQL